MSEPNSPTDPYTPTAVVTDPDDFNRQQRFKEIHDARHQIEADGSGNERGSAE